MKFYVHLEAAEPDFTMPVAIDAADTRTVTDLKVLFLNTYNSKFGQSLDAANFMLLTSKKKKLDPGEKIVALGKSGTDLFITPRTGKSDATPTARSAGAVAAVPTAPSPQKPTNTASAATPAAAKPATAAAASSSTNKVAPAAPKPKSGATASSGPNRGWVRPDLPDISPQPQVRQWMKESLQVARQLHSKGSVRQACEAWKQIIIVCPGEKECFRGLAEAAAECGRYEEAIDFYCQCVSVCTLEHGDHVETLTKLGETCLAVRDYQAALLYTQRALELRLAKDSSDPCDSLQILLGKILYASGSQDTAIQLYTHVLQRNENDSVALREYAKAYIDRQRPNEALRILLRVLVHAPNDSDTRSCISDIVKTRGGMDVLLAELGDAAKSGPALAFMATLIKDYGAVEESVVLYYKALECNPEMTTYVLNLVHTLEVCNRYQEAMELSIKYCRQHGTRRIGGHHSNAQVAAVFEGMTDVYSRRLRLPWQQGESDDGLLDTVVWVPNYGSVVVAKGKESEVSEEGSRALPSPAASAPDKAAQKVPPYSSDELDLLALHFTMVKILYVVGALALVPRLVKIIEEARRGWDMHLTTIRNEHAYYCCVAQLMCDVPHPYPEVKCSGIDALYVCGDSHSLSSAWQILSIHGTPTPLIPKLVTGLKCWHLRPESVFFPKNNFFNVVDSIPRGARVLFLFGEIDCREGIIRAVEKGRYSDIEQGVSVTIEYYISVLEKLQSKYKWNIFVQPVAPVLNETRDLVKVFNRLLKTMVEASACLHFLDIMHALLTPDGHLHPDFEMDGTHMSPKYVRLLEESLNKLEPEKCLATSDSAAANIADLSIVS